MSEISDEQLVYSFQQTGEMCHFNELVGRHIKKVRYMVYPIVLNDADADEITQEVFLRVVKNISEFKAKARFSSWLYRIAMNTTYSYLKRNSKRPVESLEHGTECVDPAPDPDNGLMTEETARQITQAMSKLSPPLRAAITLTALQGMSVGNAAKAEGCLRATMYWRIHEARRILRKSLNTELMK